MHATLTPKNNLRLIVLWAAACVVTAIFFARPALWTFFLIGTVFGGIGGYLQLCALRQSSDRMLTAKTAMSVRRALSSSRWGKMYLMVFWVGNITILLGAFADYNKTGISLWAAGYCSFALMRELISLPGTYELQRLENMATEQATKWENG